MNNPNDKMAKNRIYPVVYSIRRKTQMFTSEELNSMVERLELILETDGLSRNWHRIYSGLLFYFNLLILFYENTIIK